MGAVWEANIFVEVKERHEEKWDEPDDCCRVAAAREQSKSTDRGEQKSTRRGGAGEGSRCGRARERGPSWTKEKVKASRAKATTPRF